MSDIIGYGANSIERFVRNDEDTVLLKTTFYDDNALRQNQRIRNEMDLSKAKLGLHDNANIRMAISIPSTEQYDLWKTKNPEDYELLMSKDEHKRMRGAKRLQILHPDWVIQARF